MKLHNSSPPCSFLLGAIFKSPHRSRWYPLILKKPLSGAIRRSPMSCGTRGRSCAILCVGCPTCNEVNWIEEPSISRHNSFPVKVLGRHQKTRDRAESSSCPCSPPIRLRLADFEPDEFLIAARRDGDGHMIRRAAGRDGYDPGARGWDGHRGPAS